MTALSSQLGYQVKLEQFEGPLALLLYLIRKEEMDIYDIPITRITKQYLEYVKKMRQLDLEVAGEFVAMAATLIHIKSRMLLPTYDENGEVVEQEDPRKELVQQLLEYQKYQEAAQKLYERPLLGRDYWPKGLRESIEPEKEGEILITEDNALFALIGAYRKMVRQIKKGVHKVGAKGQSIAQRILELREKLSPGHRTTLSQLVKEKNNDSNKLLITFLSLLELGKMGFVSLFQSEVYADIHVDVRQEVDRDVIARVEEYDSKGSAEMAEAITSLESNANSIGNEIEFSDDESDVELAQSGSEVQLSLVENNEQEEVVGLGEEMATDEEIAAEEALLDQEMSLKEDSNLESESADSDLESFVLNESSSKEPEPTL